MLTSLRKIADLDNQWIQRILETAFACKSNSQNLDTSPYQGKIVAMIFEKPSLRTKVAFEVAAASLGATPVFLSSSQIFASGQGVKGRESVADIARNLERFADLILARVFNHDVIEEVARVIDKPVINALCDKHHPTQALADLMCIKWHMPEKERLKVAYIGDGNNVATSLVQILALQGIDVAIASPSAYELPKEEQELAMRYAEDSGSTLFFSNSPAEALKNADFVYTDTFVSMGQEEEREKRLQDFEGFQVNTELLALASPQAKFMHCLPAHRGEEVTDEVMDGPQSVVFDQAECRLHIAKSLYIHMLR